MLSTHFASDAPNAPAYSSASALFLAMIFFFFFVYAFKRCRPTSATPALDDVLVSFLQPSLRWRRLSLLNSCPRIRKLGSIASLSRVCHSLAQLVHWECYVRSVLTEEQASGHVRPVSFTSSTIGVCTVFFFSSPRLSTRTSTCRGSC